MKTIISITLLVLISVQSFSQINRDKSFYEEKVIKYTNMKRTGTALTVVGGALTIVGVIVLSNSSIITIDDGYGNVETFKEGNPGLGAVTFLFGAAGLGSGIPLTIVGSKSKRKYEAKLQSLSFKLNANPNQAGLTMMYRF